MKIHEIQFIVNRVNKDKLEPGKIPFYEIIITIRNLKFKS